MPLVTTQNVTPARAVLNTLSTIAQRQFTMRLNDLRTTLNAVWRSPDPQAVFDEAGTGASALFTIAGAEVAALTAMSEQVFDAAGHAANVTAIEKAVAVVKPYTINPDGTVTVTPPPSAAPPAPAS